PVFVWKCSRVLYTRRGSCGSGPTLSTRIDRGKGERRSRAPATRWAAGAVSSLAIRDRWVLGRVSADRSAGVGFCPSRTTMVRGVVTTALVENREFRKTRCRRAELRFSSAPRLYTRGTTDAQEVTFFTEEPLITKERQAVTTPFPSRTRSEGTSRTRRSGWAKPTTEAAMHQSPSCGSG